EQDYQQKLQRYEQEFSRAIRSSFPVDNYAREGLKNFQQVLDLKDEDIARLEAPLLKTREAEYQKQQAEKLRQQQEAARLQQQEADRLREHQAEQPQHWIENSAQPQRLSRQQDSKIPESKAEIALRYAGFWRRFTAILIDGFISVMIAGNAYTLIYNLYMFGSLFCNISPYILVMIYVVSFESSSLKATLGKLIMGLAVTDLDGNRISLARSTARYLTWTFPILLYAIVIDLNIILAQSSMALWSVVILILAISFFASKKKQGLHDRFTNCVVIRR
ncbi:MAG: RDD family protein, partial [Phormidesmis sp. CAN_BIN44]|nr:RDD family protein [Phormidesmis sp. CAN_BIN44]